MGDEVSPWSDSIDDSFSRESSRSSSTQSWIDDTELTVTRELKEQYEKFEEALFSERSLDELPKSLQAEVKIWAEHSPHIRIRGVKANLHERTEPLIEEDFDTNYEEIIETHGSLEESLEKGLSFSEDVKQAIEHCSSDEQEIIKTDLKNAIVDKLLDHALPRVLEKFEPVIKSVSAGQRNTVKDVIDQCDSSYIDNLRNQKNQRLSARSSKSGQGYMKDLVSRKPLPFSDSTRYQSALSSRGLRRRGCDRIPEQPVLRNDRDQPSYQRPVKAKVNRSSSLSTHRVNGGSTVNLKTKSSQKVKKVEEEKKCLLPAIETLPITPKLQAHDKRSVSAMVRFNKTLPRVGPNTARNMTGVPSIFKSSEYIEETNNRNEKSSERKDKSSFDSELKVVGIRSATSLKSNRWRY